MIEITTELRNDGRSTASCEWNGKAFSASGNTGAVAGLARVLASAGCPDQPWRTQRGLSGRSIHHAAATTLRETTGAPVLVRWVPHPHAEVSAVLLAAVRPIWDARDAQKAARAVQLMGKDRVVAVGDVGQPGVGG